MDTLKLGGREFEFKFTTFALSKLKEVDIEKIETMAEQGKVLYIADIILEMVYAMVSSQGLNTKIENISSMLDELFEKGEITPNELLTKLMEALTSSPFFKALMKKEQKQEETKVEKTQK